jgi:DNA invertase Pin-like site-specific DNA recombinase
MTKILTRPAAAPGSAVDAPEGRQGRSIGLARVSTKGQTTGPQEAALRAAGCELVFCERVSTRVAEKDRPQLQRCLAELQPGDELTVTKLDRLGRTQREVIARLADLQGRGIHVRSLDGLFNSKALGPTAPVMLGLLTGLAEMERTLISERTRASVEHRRATGGDLGGRPLSYTPEQAEQVRRLSLEGMSIAAIARATGLSESTCRRLRAAAGEGV